MTSSPNSMQDHPFVVQSLLFHRRIFAMVSTVIVTIFMGFFSTIGAAVSDTSSNINHPTPLTVNIGADKQTYNQQDRNIILNGNVDVTIDNIRVKSPEAKVILSKVGEPLVANFFQRPFALRQDPLKGNDNLEADIIRVLMRENVMRAEGNVVTHVASVASDPFLIRADVQQFNNITKTVEAEGSVKVQYKEFDAQSPKAILKVGKDGQAEQVLFLGGVRLKKGKSTITSGSVKVMVQSGNLVAENHVVTDVKSSSKNVRIKSDYQQYDKGAGTMLASGHVHITYDDYVATGPKATFRLNEESVERIVLTGRSSITDQDRQITADTITITTTPKKFDAVGNVKTKFKTARKPETTAPTKERNQAKTPPQVDKGMEVTPLSPEEEELLNY